MARLMGGLRTGLFAAAVALSGYGIAAPAALAGTAVGPEKCGECHKAETEVWQGTPHFDSFKTIRSKPQVKDVIAAAGGEADMRKNDTCTLCHFTMVGGKPVSGPSCENCHGAASDWINVHNDFGGPSVTAQTEAPAHKADRQAKSGAAGMIWPSMKYEVAKNCYGCHGMMNPGLDGDKLAKMIGAGHPVSEFELVAFSQGKVRHRFYPPDMTTNAEMTPAETARLYATGQAASLVISTQGAKKSSDPKYTQAMKDRIAKATKTLEALKATVPEAGALLGKADDASAKAFVAAIQSKDLTGAIGGMLPAKDGYK